MGLHWMTGHDLVSEDKSIEPKDKLPVPIDTTNEAEVDSGFQKCTLKL